MVSNIFLWHRPSACLHSRADSLRHRGAREESRPPPEIQHVPWWSSSPSSPPLRSLHTASKALFSGHTHHFRRNYRLPLHSYWLCLSLFSSQHTCHVAPGQGICTPSRLCHSCHLFRVQHGRQRCGIDIMEPPGWRTNLRDSQPCASPPPHFFDLSSLFYIGEAVPTGSSPLSLMYTYRLSQPPTVERPIAIRGDSSP